MTLRQSASQRTQSHRHEYVDYADIFGREQGLLDELCSSDDEFDDPEELPETASQAAAPTLSRLRRGGDDARGTMASPGLSVAGRKAGRLEVMKSQAREARPSTSHDSSQPIARRTRGEKAARGDDFDVDMYISLDDVLVDIDDQELEEIENFGKVFDDDEEYRKFLASLGESGPAGGGDGGGDGGGGEGEGAGGQEGVRRAGDDDDDDDDDDDFMNELQELVMYEMDDSFGGTSSNLFKANGNLTSAMPIEQISSLFRKRGNYQGRKPYSKPNRQLRRSQRVENMLEQKKRYAARLMAKRKQEGQEGQNGAGDMHCLKKNRQETAALAALTGVADFELKTMAMKDGTLVPIPSEWKPGMFQDIAETVVWKPPLPSTIRKAHAKLELAMQNDETVDESVQRQVQMNMFNDHQRQKLVMHIRHHVQMCYQTLVLAVAQQEDQALIAQLKRTLLSSMEGLFPAMRSLGVRDVLIWEDGIHGLVDLMERSEKTRGCSDHGSTELTGDYSKIGGRATTQREIASHVWTHLPYPMISNVKMAKIKTCFDSTFEPRQSVGRFTQHKVFTPAEDKLLAWGIRKYMYDWRKIHHEFLPIWEPEKLKQRKKNSSASTGSSNVVSEAIKCINMPLTRNEIALLDNAINYMGKVRNKHITMEGWETICSDYLPWRSAKALSMLWAAEEKRRKERRNGSVEG